MLSNLSKVVQSSIQNVTVVGGGQMGSGIAQVAAAHGQKVTIVDLDTNVLKKSEATINPIRPRLLCGRLRPGVPPL